MTANGAMPQIDDAGLLQYGENIARNLSPDGFAHGKSLAGTLLKNIRFLRQRHTAFEHRCADGELPLPCGEWLLDNFYLAQREGVSSAEDLKSCKKIPASKGEAVLFVLCRALLRAGGGEVTPARITLFLTGCQQVYVLSRRELSCFVPSLKAACIGELALLYAGDLTAASCAETAGRLFSTLRALSTLDLSKVLEQVDVTEQILREDPAGIYAELSEKTRTHYKRKIEKLAIAYRLREHTVARQVLKFAQKGKGREAHVGYWLLNRPMGEEAPQTPETAYLAINLLLPLFLALALAFATKSPLAGLLSLLPFTDLTKTLTDALLLSFVTPAHIPRLELSQGVPPSGRTLCVISALLTNEEAGPKLSRRLEEFRLANRCAGENLLFGILADLPDAKEKSLPEDEKNIAAVRNAIETLNKKYGGGFFFLIRERRFNQADGLYSPWERKRGAITELAALLCGKENSLLCLSGSVLALHGVRYILTLDEDTRLLPGAARELIGAMLHPLNTPVIDPKSRKVTEGHALIHPRISVELSSSNKSRFSRIFAGQGGTDPYGSDSSEVYMDVFGNGGFAGKGILDTEALLTCMDERIPENRVLSHDALEGAFLRGGYMGDSELTDKYPSDLLSYYKRLHRWTRGDWQNLPWLFSRGKALTDIDRFRLYDSARRSLLPPSIFIAFLCAFFRPTPGFTAAASIALLSLAVRLVLAAFQKLFSDEREARQRCHSGISRGLGEAFLQTAIRLALLPYEAYICLTAALTALWRMLISGKGLLRWTPASVFEGKSQGLTKYLRAMWVSPAVGLICLLLATAIIGRAAGVIWLFAGFFAFSLSKPISRKTTISAEDKTYLLTCALRIWSFFEDFCTPEDHYLPPDNWQERPSVGVARRTSPTNIGLCLLSCVSAMDLKLTTDQKALGLIQNILATLRRMPKWNGHLYNWYDTRSLRSLHPAYVSTVDSGNLAVCLLILREAMLEYERPDLAEACDELLAPMSFLPLYDEAHRLFTIGIDVERELVTNSFYDLMASEARTTGFLAIARGEISRRHWRTLSRAMVEKDGYRGMVSWTGSMFEYLMPRLFFESVEGSLMFESLHFAVGVQKRCGKRRGLPWGVSESAFFSLDPCLNYQYKAHGCAPLALKRNMNQEYVVSPYSSFLALCSGVKSVIRNLRRLEKYGAWGKYGFWEAVDFTEGRVAGRGGEVVRCVMAHHIGMSLIAITNALLDNPMPRRLMRNPAMSAHACLLEERLPLGGVLLRRKENKLPEKPPRARSVYWSRSGESADPFSPNCCLLSNGDYSIMLTDSGVSYARCGKLTPYYTSPEPSDFSHGVALYLQSGDKLLPLLPAAREGQVLSWDLSLSGAAICTQQEDLRAEIGFAVSEVASGEKRTVTLKCSDGSIQSCSLIVLFEPLLADLESYLSHPAFFRLGLHARAQNNTLILRRLKREGLPECFLCLAASEKMEVSARRGLIPGRGGLISALDNNIPSNLGWLYDPLVCAKIPLKLVRGEETTLTLALAVSDSENEAYTAANRILAGGETDAADYPAIQASRLGLTENQLSKAMQLLNALSFPRLSLSENPPPRSALWRFGISGNLPILTHNVTDEESLEEAETLIRQHAFLTSLSRPFDLVFLTDDGGDYMRPAATALSELKRDLGGGSGNIHMVDRSSGVEVLLECSINPLSGCELNSSSKTIMSTDFSVPAQSFPAFFWGENDEFCFHVNHSLPPRAWGNILTNGRFGFFATDCGTGHLWHQNAREYHINRWLCDSLATRGTEQFILRGKSLFAAPEDTDCLVRFGLGYAVWEKEIEGLRLKTRAFVPPDTDCRILIVEWEGGQSLPLHWSTDLVLGGDALPSPRARVREEGGVFIAENPESPFPASPFLIASSVAAKGHTTSRNLWLRGKTDGSMAEGGFLGLTFEAESPFVLVCGCDDQKKLQALCAPAQAAQAFEITCKSWEKSLSAIKIKTPLPALDRLINGWIPYQALACRLMGRCSIYQSGGATGFRDQLQDAVNVILLDPGFAKRQIIESCRHQYEEGDVMHWWHTLAAETKGVRTHCSDDLLWLPWALCEYTEKTGDLDLCHLPVQWLNSPPLRPDERDRYETAVYTEAAGTVLEHAKKALSLVLKRGTGEHGLLKIGKGDWNDGMDRIGEKGQGESVWLTWFFSRIAGQFSALLERLDEKEAAKQCKKAARELGKRADAAWDGNHYLRGYFDDGTPLGSESHPACKIDSIAQSFAAFCPESDPEKVNTALGAAVNALFDAEHKLIRLFAPSFEDAEPYPGYIESYGPGFRENGGQYTHGAIWLIMALLRENRADEALPLLEALIPENRDLPNYEGEPFVLAADVYSNPDNAGKAGWTWYTGSAGWFFRLVVEELLGLKLENGALTLSPRLPSSWEGCQLRLRTSEGREQTFFLRGSTATSLEDKSPTS